MNGFVLSDAFSASIEMIFLPESVNIVNYISRFSNADPTLHAQDRSYLYIAGLNSVIFVGTFVFMFMRNTFVFFLSGCGVMLVEAS